MLDSFFSFYMDGFEEAKSLVGKAYHDLDLSAIKPVVDDNAIT